MNIDNFEERIKKTFERHRPETDNDAIWENIEPHLRKKKKRRAVIFWMLGLGLLLLLFRYCGWGDYAALHNTPVEAKNSATTSPGNAAREKAAESPSPGKIAAVPPDHAVRQEVRVVSGGEYAIPNTIATAPAANDNTTAELGPATEEAAQVQTLSNEIRLKNPDTATIRFETGERETTQPPAMPEMQETQRDALSDVAVPSESRRPLNERGGAKSGEKDKKMAKNAKKVEKKPVRARSKKRRPAWEHNLGIQAGPALAIRLLSDGGAVSAPAGLLEGRKATESSLESFSAGMFYSVATPKGFVMKTGLEYRQVNEKFHLAYNKTETEQINGILTITVDNAGNPIGQTTGPKTVTKTTEYSNTAYNHYRFVNLPLGIGYRHGGSKSRWELSGGVDFNLLFRAEGTIYNSEIVPAPFRHGTTSYGNIFRNNAGMGLWAEYGYDRRLADRLRWLLSVNVQMPLRPVSSPHYELVQRYFNFGVQAGVVYQVIKGKKRK